MQGSILKVPGITSMYGGFRDLRIRRSWLEFHNCKLRLSQKTACHRSLVSESIKRIPLCPDKSMGKTCISHTRSKRVGTNLGANI